MSFEHNAIFPETGLNILYTPVQSDQENARVWEMKCHSDGNECNDEIFYLSFNDCLSSDDKEGFLLMCSENELKELVNHLRMIRGV